MGSFGKLPVSIYSVLAVLLSLFWVQLVIEQQLKHTLWFDSVINQKL